MEKPKQEPKVYSLHGVHMPYPFKSEKFNTVGSMPLTHFLHHKKTETTKPENENS